MIDLHVHTTASDGQFSPSQIIQMAVDKGLSRIAITDHDTAAGLEEAKAAAQELKINFVAGTELNISFPTGEFHLLGLGFTNISPSLNEIFEDLVKSRQERNENIISKMQKDGVQISLEEVQKDYPDTILGRPHFAAELVKKKVVKNRQMAFDKYLAKGRPWYVDRVGANLDQAIVAIKESGGLPVVAHPMSLYLSWGKLPETLQNFYERGVAGIEAYHPGARMTECLRLEELARKIGFFVTAGSDFHGPKVRADRKLGHTCNDKPLENRFWDEELGKYLNRI